MGNIPDAYNLGHSIGYNGAGVAWHYIKKYKWVLICFAIILVGVTLVRGNEVVVGYGNHSLQKVVIGGSEEVYGLLDGINIWLQLNNFTALSYFPGGLNLGTTTDASAGNLRYTSSQFQGYNGTDWVALSGTGGADTTCNDVACSLGDDTDYLFTSLDFTSTTGFSDLVDNDTVYDDTVIVDYMNNQTGTDCDAGNYSYGVNADGTLKCRDDLQGAAGSGVAYFINYTPITTTGNITNGTLKGYPAANQICNSYYVGSHMCTADEVLNNINANLSNQNYTATFRMSEIAPGYLANANDCEGWTSAASAYLGSIWVGSTSHANTYGSGSLVSCSAARAIGCCK